MIKYVSNIVSILASMIKHAINIVSIPSSMIRYVSNMVWKVILHPNINFVRWSGDHDQTNHSRELAVGIK